MVRQEWNQIVVAISVAISLGFLESAWVGPGRGGPTNVWLGVFAILIGLMAVTFPKVWRVPALAILEETVHLLASGGTMTWNRIFQHWSVGLIGVNLYVYISFPILTLVGEISYFVIHRRYHRT